MPTPPAQRLPLPDHHDGLTVRVEWNVDGSTAKAVEAQQAEALVRLLLWMRGDAQDTNAAERDERSDGGN